MNPLAALKNLLRPLYKRFFPASWSVRSYSQEGEDILIGALLATTSKGYYVDIGCHHPHRFSNTYLLYKRGWSGLCIDPLPGTRRAFAQARPRDVVVEVGISLELGKLNYFMFNEAALNTFDPELAHVQAMRTGFHIERTITCPTRPLRTLLEEQGVGQIDFMTIDVEGLDLEVLSSNDWTRWRPRVLIAESLDVHLNRISEDPIHAFMTAQGYLAVQKVGRNIIFVEGQK